MGKAFIRLITMAVVPLVFASLALGIALTYLPSSRSQPVVNFLDGLNEAIIQLVHLIMKVAPYGVFALMAAVTGRFGYSILITLIKCASVVLIGLAIHLGGMYCLLVRTLGGMSPLLLEGIALILGVDRILDMCRTVVNMTGDATCAVFIARTEKKYKSVTAVPEELPEPEIGSEKRIIYSAALRHNTISDF